MREYLPQITITNTMTTDEIYDAIKSWKTLIDSYKKGDPESLTKILNYLTQGTHFSVNGTEIEKWKEYLKDDPLKAINAYVGIDNDQLKFFLIDSKNDSDPTFDPDTIVVKQFNRKLVEEADGSYDYAINMDATNTDPVISLESAIFRNFRWNIFGSVWLKAIQADPDSLFQIVSIPFEDFCRLELEAYQSCISFLGLTDRGANSININKYNIDIITVKALTVNKIIETAQNYSTPRPPFSLLPETNFQLLLRSHAQS